MADGFSNPNNREEEYKSRLERRKNQARDVNGKLKAKAAKVGGKAVGQLGGSAVGGTTGAGFGAAYGGVKGAISGAGVASVPAAITGAVKGAGEFGVRGARIGGRYGRRIGGRLGKYAQRKRDDTDPSAPNDLTLNISKKVSTVAARTLLFSVKKVILIAGLVALPFLPFILFAGLVIIIIMTIA